MFCKMYDDSANTSAGTSVTIYASAHLVTRAESKNIRVKNLNSKYFYSVHIAAVAV